MKRNVFCLCLADWRDAIAPKFSEVAGPNWHDGGLVTVKWLSESELTNEKNNQRTITEKIKDGSPCDFLLIGDISYDGPQLPTPITSVRRITDPKDFRSQIQDILEANGVDLVSVQAEYLGKRWETFKVTSDHISQWLRQFNDLGEFEWVGRGILSAIRCFSTPELVGLLGVASIEASEQIVYYSPKEGDLGSSSPLAHAVAKNLGTRPVLPFDASVARAEKGRYALIEDCSISGKEFVHLLNDTILAKEPTQDDRMLSIKLLFSVIANGAELRINQEVQERGLLNCRLDTTYAEEIATLTSEGLLALEGKTFYCEVGKHCLNPSRFINYQLFSTQKHWGSLRRADTAKRLLRRIGEKLYRADFIRRKGSYDSRSDEWFSQAGLGAGGLALNIALARSIPKSTLPVVWAEGKIEWGGTEIDWIPLLPHSESRRH